MVEVNNIKIKINGRSARRLYVEHTAFGVPVPEDVYITDDEGVLRDRSGNAAMESNWFTEEVDIRILCQNSIARVLRPSLLSNPVEIFVDKHIPKDNYTVDLNTEREFKDHFAILELAMDNYERVHRRFPPFRGMAMQQQDFPLGRLASLRDTKNQNKRIEIVFPDILPQPLAFTEPAFYFSTGYPLIHIKANFQDPSKPNRPFDERLFGTGKSRPTLIASELAHGLHFSLLTSEERDRITGDYLKFLITDLPRGGGTHFFSRSTSHMVAYIEALDHFSGRFSEFLRVGPKIPVHTNEAKLFENFIFHELRDPKDHPYWMPPRLSSAGINFQAGVRQTNGTIIANHKGGDVEGAMYGAIFLDFASRIGLLRAVGAYHNSHALNWGEFRGWVERAMSHDENALKAIKEVALTWGL